VTATRVLVTGARGQVGVDLLATLAGESPPGSDPTWQPDDRAVRADEFEVVGRGRAELDVTDATAVAAELERTRPAVVVNLAAFTAVDAAEADPVRCDQVNHVAVGSLVAACTARGAHVITISTDYVFDGTKGAAYVEDDAPAPLNVYGRTKRDGEVAATSAATVVRTSWVMGRAGRPLARVVAERAAAGEPMAFVTDQVGTLTASADLARALITLIRVRPGGLWHVANDGAVSRFEIASWVADHVGRRDLVRAITTDDLDPAPAARRPARSDLATNAWRAAGFAPLPSWRAALNRVVEGH
jgi:dTDP-4-dehydrorhamnose reductase